MPICPECGYEAEASLEWFETIDYDVSNDKFPCLVVCPHCETVLGGSRRPA